MSNKPASPFQRYTLVVHEFGYTTGHGGIATYALNRARALKSHGFDLTLICFETSFDKSQQEILKDIYFIPGGLSAINASHWISKKLDEIGTDVIETSDYQGWLADYLVKSRLGLTKNRTFVDVRHHTATREIFEWNNFEDIRLAHSSIKEVHQLEIIQQRLANRNTFPSKFLHDYISQFEPVSNSHFESYPLQVPETAPVKASRSPNKSMHIISLGRLEKRKGLIHLVNSLNHFPGPISLTIVGNSAYEESGDSYRRVLSNAMSDELLARTHFIDFVQKKDFQSLFESADLFVIPSTYENFPYAAIEGILQGIPILVSKFSGLADFIQNKNLVFDPTQKGSLKESINRSLILWKENRLQDLAHEQFLQFKDFVNENRFREIDLSLNAVISSRVINWQLKKKLGLLKPNDSLLVSGKVDIDDFPKNLDCQEFTRDMMVAFTSEHEIFSNLNDVLRRELPFLLPLLTQAEVDKINNNFILGIVEVMAGRPKVVSMSHRISKISTGLRTDYFGNEKFDFLKSRGEFR